MKHVRATNRKAQRRARLMEDEQPDLYGQQLPLGCTTIFDPGWEADPLGGTRLGCTPLERDLYGCYGDCWWIAQVPDGLTNYPNWWQDCPAVSRDWQNLKFVE